MPHSSPTILTITLNPALDKSSKVDRIIPEQKLMCTSTHIDAGGGGINVAKAIHRLGGKVNALFTAGGYSGEVLQQLIQAENIPHTCIPTQNNTRENTIIVEKSTNFQYRFGMQSTAISPTDIQNILTKIKESTASIIVISGSIPIGTPVEIYNEIAQIATKKNAKCIVDTSGEALESVYKENIYLLKPNLQELYKLAKVDALEIHEVDDVARELLHKSKCEMIAVSLGSQGAIIVTKNHCEHLPAPPVHKKSTVGAGDSMVGGMVWALAHKKTLSQVLRWGVACGAAATMNEGTHLFEKEQAEKLYQWLKKYGEKFKIALE